MKKVVDVRTGKIKCLCWPEIERIENTGMIVSSDMAGKVVERVTSKLSMVTEYIDKIDYIEVSPTSIRREHPLQECFVAFYKAA